MSEKLKVLLVDDQPGYRRRAVDALSSQGCDVRTAADGREAIALGSGYRPDVIVSAWMLEGRPSRAALDLPLASGDDVTVRNRRPGDRIRPLGCRYSRRLKEVLIDRRVPRHERDRLPLLCLRGRIAWVPGVTVDDSFRLSPASRPWVARIEPA